MFDNRRDRRYALDVGEHLAVLAGPLNHRHHAPRTQNGGDVKASQLYVREGLVSPVLEVKAQAGLLVPAQRVVLEDGHRSAVVRDKLVAIVVLAVELPKQGDLALFFLYTVVLRALCTNVNDAIATR